MLPMPQIILSAVSVSPTLIWCIIGIAVFLLLYMEMCWWVSSRQEGFTRITTSFIMISLFRRIISTLLFTGIFTINSVRTLLST